MLKLSNKKRNISYFIELEMTYKEEEILEELSSACNMTICEYIHFLMLKRLQNYKKVREKGWQVL